MIGAIIGDVVGSRFEFNNYSGGPIDLTADSTFTDDTVCTIAVADFIIAANELGFASSDRFAGILRSWCKRYPNRGYGNTFQQWIHSGSPVDSYGNGAGMRISPVGLFCSKKAGLRGLVKMITSVSHSHPEGLKGAGAIALAGYLARRESKDVIKKAIESEFGYNLDINLEALAVYNPFNETCQVTVPQALACFLQGEDFEDVLRLAISIGGDSDTIAAMACGVAEAFFGGVPSDLWDGVKAKLPAEMIQVVERFYDLVPV